MSLQVNGLNVVIFKSFFFSLNVKNSAKNQKSVFFGNGVQTIRRLTGKSDRTLFPGFRLIKR